MHNCQLNSFKFKSRAMQYGTYARMQIYENSYLDSEVNEEKMHGDFWISILAWFLI